MTQDQWDVAIIGGGPAGRAAAIFTARHGLDTVLLDAGKSILRRNAHLENYPGFPAGVDARRLLELMAEQAARAGCELQTETVSQVDPCDDGFVIETQSANTYHANTVVAATKNTVDYLDHLPDVEIVEPGKHFVVTDDRGRTGITGLYAAGRLARKPHQTIVCAGHGAEVAVTLLEDADVGFYHDWVAPEGYFTGRGREVPPGCEEIDDDERRRRDAEAREVMQSQLAAPFPDEPEQHPSLIDDE